MQEFLVGKCIISRPKIDEGIMNNSIVYIFSQIDEETYGFIINKKADESSGGIILQSNFDNKKNITLYKGGKKDNSKAFIIHTSDYKDTTSTEVDGEISVSSSIDVIKDIIKGIGPRKSLVVLGYNSWNTKQLYSEIKRSDWWIIDASERILFSDEDTKWDIAVKEILGVDIDRLYFVDGSA